MPKVEDGRYELENVETGTTVQVDVKDGKPEYGDTRQANGATVKRN